MATRAQGRKAKNTADMVRSLVVTLVGGAALFGTVFFVFYRDAHTSAVKAIPASDLTAQLAGARRDLGALPLPSSTPPGWTVTSARYAPLDPSATSGDYILHIGYVTKAGHYVDFEAGPVVDDALDPYDGSHAVATGLSQGDLQVLKSSDGIWTLKGAGKPLLGMTGTKDLAELTELQSVLRSS